MQALIHTFHTRLMPAMLYGVELTVHVAKFDKLLHGLQATCLGRLLACCGVPRIVLLHEFGIQDRWSALAWMRAIALKRRVQTEPRYWQEHEIFVLADDGSTTWAAAVASQEHACGLRPLPTELQSKFLTPNQRKARLHQQYQLVIQPAVRVLELNCWSATPRARNHWSAYNEDH